MKYQHYDKLEKYVEDGLLEVNKHPTEDLYIYNYSRKTQYESLWDDVTIQCRGLVLDGKGEIIAKAFDKFFNIEEEKDLSWECEHVWVQEKMDGSLGILFHYNDNWHMATRGSFTSDQAIKGMEILKKKYDLKRFMPEAVYICEIIYPENRIVVDYAGEEKIVFLSVSSNDTELNWNTAVLVFSGSGIEYEDIVMSNLVFDADATMADHLKAKNEENREGYVLRFWPSNKRVKIKFTEYVRLHKILTGISNIDIWEHLKAERDVNELLENVPDEFDKWVKSTVSDLRYACYQYREYCGKLHDYFRYGKYGDREPEPTKKEYAEHLITCNVHPKVRPICFAMWDGKNKKVDDIIWKLVKPKHQKPFWNQKETEINNQTKFSKFNG
jgi:RNA ligase